MTKYTLYIFTLVLLTNFGLQAQTIETITKSSKTTSTVKLACDDQFAGNVILDQDDVIAQSIATELPGPIFLCYQDRFTIQNANANLTGDPDNTTTPGVGYAFYDCPPTITGPTLAAIEADPCVLDTPPVPVDEDYDLWVYTDENDGTALFQNSNQLGGQTIPQFFNNGNPTQIYFAPITFDDFDNNEDEDAGMCVNVNASDAFPVVYLNEIQILNCEVQLVNNEYVGSFTLEGGFPEYNGSTYTTVAIIKNNNFNNQAQITGGPFMHGDLVEFVADEEGSYTIVVEDGISCGAAKDIEFTESEKELTITATPPGGPYNPGGFFCVEYTVADFDSIETIAWSFNFDPTVLQFNTVIGFNLPGLSIANFVTIFLETGNIAFLWDDFSALGVTLADDEKLFEVCFDIIGDPGDCSAIFIDGTPTAINAGCCGDEEVEIVFVDTEICIEPPNVVTAFAGTCAANGSDQGSITFYAIGGTAPYTYSSPCFPAGTLNAELEEETINNLTSGSCTITITDDAGASTQLVVNVSNNPSIQYDIQTTNPSCFGVPNGQIKLDNITGGNPDYEIAWSNGFYNVDSIRFLDAGTYFATITDDLGCEIEQAFVIGIDPIEVAINIIDTTTCIDVEDGVITADAFGGTPSPGNRYTYQWNNPNLFEADVVTSTNSDIPNGIGEVKVTDSNGCSVTVAYEMDFKKFVTADIVFEDILCADSLGSITVTGGTSNNSCSNFAFSWSGGVSSINTATTSLAEDLPGGSYSVIITDCDGCRLDTTIMLENPAAIFVNDFIEFGCADPTGTITLFAGGGTGTLMYAWSDDPLETGPIRNDVPPGTYTVTITDQNNCELIETYELSVDGAIAPDTFYITPISCAGDSDGVITVETVGMGDFDYMWEGPDGPVGNNDPTISNVEAGLYYITISDDMGCSVVDSVELISPDTIFVDVDLMLPSCNGESDGSISLIVTGGTPGYSYSWDGFPTNITEVLPSISPGDYAVTVFDMVGCTFDTIINLPDQEIIDIDVNVLNGISCNGESNAQVEVEFSGGVSLTGNYGVLWSNGEDEPLGMITTDTAFMLGAGTNSVIVFDENCSDTLEFDIIEPEPITVNQSQTIVNNASCFGLCDGSVEVVAQGGDGNFSYTWVVSGNTNAVETGLCSGWVFVDILDGFGCLVRDSVFVNQPDSLELNVDIFSTVNPACNNDGDGIVVVDYTGGNVGPVSYMWTGNVSDDASASGLENGTYVITVTDGMGCTDTTSYTLSSPPPIEATVPSPMAPVCFGDQTCIEVLEPSGGSGMGYRFSINNSSLFPIDSCVNVFAGEYNVSVFDSDGCQFDTMIVISQPSELLASLGDDITVDLGDTTTILEVQLNQTFMIDTIIWTGTENFVCLDPFCTRIRIFPTADGVYTVMAVDQDGCIATDEINVFIDDERKVYFPNAFTPNGDGINDNFQLFTGIGVVSVPVLQVFDRWGNKMFDEKNLSPNPGGTIGWDGSFNGQSLDPGVYVYRAEVGFVDGKVVKYSGTITLIR